MPDKFFIIHFKIHKANETKQKSVENVFEQFCSKTFDLQKYFKLRFMKYFETFLTSRQPL